MRRVGLLLLTLTLVSGPAAAGDEPVAPPRPLTQGQAADAVLAAFRAEDREALKTLAGKDAPDPWIVADELIRRGASDAAEAFAQADPRADVAGLPGYVAARGGTRDDPARRKVLAAVNAALAAGKHDQALEALGPEATGPIEDVVGVRLAMGRGAALAALARLPGGHSAFTAAAEAAERLGWLAQATRAYHDAGAAAFRASGYAAAAAAWERALALCDRRGDRRGAATTLANLGLVHYALGDRAKALAAYERALAAQEALGDRAGAARTLGNVGNLRRSQGDYAGALAAYERALAAQEALGDQEEAAATRSNIGNVLYSQGDYPGALAAYERALAVQEALGDRAGAATSMCNAGSAHFALGDHAKALAAYERALSAQRALGDQAGVASTLGNVAGVHLARGEYAEALSSFERVLETQEALGDRAGVAMTLGNVGTLHVMSGDFARALSEYGRALAIEESLGDRAGAAATLGNMGVAHNSLGDHAEALSMYERALEVQEALGDRAGAATTLGNLGTIHAARGDYAKAFSAYDRALAAQQALGDKRGAARTLGSIGSLQLALGDHARALATYERALAAEEEMGDRAGAAMTRGDIGGVQYARGDYPQALSTLARALSAQEALGDKAGAATTLGNLGLVQASAGDHAKALATLERALSIAQELGARAGVAKALGNIGVAHVKRGDHARALAAYEGALAALEALEDKAGVVRTLGNLGLVELALGKPAAALVRAHRAVSQLGSVVFGLGAEEGAGAREPLGFVYDVGARAALDLHDAKELAFFLESGRAGALLEGLRARETLWDAAVPAALRADEARARKAQAAAVDALRRAQAGRDLAEMRQRRGEVKAAAEHLSAAIARIQREAKAGADLVQPVAATLAEIQETVADDEALVLYGLLRDSACALLVTRKEARVVELGTRAPIEEAVAALPLDSPSAPPEPALEALAGLVVAPLGLAASTKRVLVSPAGVLGYVPFAALMPQTTVAYLASGTTYRLLREEGGLRGEGVLALGDPDYEAQPDARALAVHRGGLRLVPLPGTREEASALGTQVLLGRQASERGLLEAVAAKPRWRSVHLACHGLVNPERPALSSLALTPADEDDGFLSALDVFRSRIPADLVVLSACETGKGQIVQTEGIVGLTRAFMFAGAPRVLCSLWKVDDEATKALMMRFYELWNPREGEGIGPAAALKEAQAFVRSHENWKHPYYWAAWVLWGLPD